MEVFLLDADTCQVSHSQAEYVSGLRKNARAWADTGVSWREHDKRAPVRNGPSSYMVRLWGRTRSGLSVCVVVANPMSTSYRRLCSRVHRSKLEALADVVRRNLEPAGLGPAGASVSVLWKHTTNGWESDPDDPDRPALVPWMQFKSSSASVKSAIHGACARAQRQSSSFADIFTPATGEKNVEVHNEVLLQANIRPGSWFVLPASAQARPCPGRVAADLVVQVLVSDLASAVQATASTPPVRVLSFDIECYSETGDFPEASQLENPIITIGLYAETFFVSAGGENAVVRALCLGETEASSDYETESFPSEAKLLLAFGRHMRESDADVVVGYNTTLFDWSYITGRVETLKKAGMLTAADAAEIFRMSRVKDKVTAPQDSTVASSAMGDNPLHFARMPGRFEVDLWFHLKRANSTDLPNLKLNTVAEHYLKDAKHDLPPQQIFEAYRSQGAAGRAKIAAYCVQDTKLVLDLVKKLEVVQSVTQMAAVTLVTPHDINFRGQQIRVYSQILRKAHALNYVVEDTGSAGGARGEEEDPGAAAAAASGYVGAHVVDPKVGHYPDPILTLDFASLYPSIMRTWNLSFDTLLRCEQPLSRRRRPPASEVPNTSHVFVKASVRRGLLPLILDELLAERKRVRSAMKTCSDPLQLSLMNGMQLALKISANSCYGFTGSTRGILLCREVAEATTGAGRHIIHQTSETLEARWPGASVVYGDTDSCFVRLPEAERNRSPAEVFAIGEEMAREVTDLFAESTEKSYIELEMEKFFCPLVLYKKKRYAGLCYKDPAKPPSMSATGIEMVRRDSAPLLRRAQKEVLDQLVVEGDVDRAVAAAKDAIEAVLATKAGGPFADLAQSKTLRSKYANPNSMVHVRVASLMEQRQPGSAPRSGERVSYLVVASLCARIVDKVDSVEHAEENLLPPDWVHYVGMLVDPLLRLLDVPLQSLAPDKYSAILEYFDVAKRRAAALVRAHALARHGVQWLSGHKVKNGTQLRLDALPGFEPPPPSAAHSLPPVTKKRRRQEAAAPSSALPPCERRRGPLDFWLETQMGSNPGSSSAAPPSSL